MALIEARVLERGLLLARLNEIHSSDLTTGVFAAIRIGESKIHYWNIREQSSPQ